MTICWIRVEFAFVVPWFCDGWCGCRWLWIFRVRVRMCIFFRAVTVNERFYLCVRSVTGFQHHDFWF